MKNRRLPRAGCRLPIAFGGGRAGSVARRQTAVANAFTLIELLLVISIAGILAALAVPALKNLGKSSANLSASRQLLDDVARARQLAINDHTTVYMIFVPTNFWTYVNPSTAAATPAFTNLCDMQLTGYSFVSFRSVGDQPGRGQTNYLAPWLNLPEGTFIPQWKFNARNTSMTISNQVSGVPYKVAGFDRTVSPIPFPSPASTVAITNLPFIAFNYLGQLTSGQDEYIPLAHGTMADAVDGNKALQFASPTVVENPPGNSTNSSFNLVHIDALTGRAVLEYQKIAP